VSASPLDGLLQRLKAGDSAAAGEIFRKYEPYLRMVVRRQLSPSLRAKFDSLDVVQSVWVHLLRGFRSSGWHFKNTAHLQAFLVQLTRHRFIDRLRRHRRMLEYERPLGRLAPVDPTATAVDQTNATDLWETLLRYTPPAYHEILQLKRDGAETAEVAARTGYHPGSIRRILHELKERVCRAERERASEAGR
jgi:RNA polymerase sigma-70 factor (ECF subfamily)